jgi:hypothetical protein
MAYAADLDAGYVLSRALLEAITASAATEQAFIGCINQVLLHHSEELVTWQRPCCIAASQGAVAFRASINGCTSSTAAECCHRPGLLVSLLLAHLLTLRCILCCGQVARSCQGRGCSFTQCLLRQLDLAFTDPGPGLLHKGREWMLFNNVRRPDCLTRALAKLVDDDADAHCRCDIRHRPTHAHAPSALATEWLPFAGRH